MHSSLEGPDLPSPRCKEDHEKRPPYATVQQHAAQRPLNLSPGHTRPQTRHYSHRGDHRQQHAHGLGNQTREEIPSCSPCERRRHTARWTRHARHGRPATRRKPQCLMRPQSLRSRGQRRGNRQRRCTPNRYAKRKNPAAKAEALSRQCVPGDGHPDTLPLDGPPDNGWLDAGRTCGPCGLSMTRWTGHGAPCIAAADETSPTSTCPCTTP